MTKALTKLADTFDWIKIKEKSKDRDFQSNLSNVKVILDMDNESSWLANPTPKVGDTFGTWPKDMDLPTSIANIVPSDRKTGLPSAIPFEFKCNDLEKFFTAKTIVQANKVKLDDRVFNPPECTVHPKENAHTIDSLLRSAISENALCDKFIMSLKDEVLKWANPDVYDNIDVEQKYKILVESLKLASISSLRAKQFTSAAFTCNKMGLRQKILDRCTGQAYSKDLLKRTSLASSGLFGPVPESFIAKLDHSIGSRESFSLKPSASISSLKRSVSSSTGPQKRLRGNGRPHFDHHRPHSSNTQSSFEKDLGTTNFRGSPRAQPAPKGQRVRKRGGRGGQK